MNKGFFVPVQDFFLTYFEGIGPRADCYQLDRRSQSLCELEFYFHCQVRAFLDGGTSTGQLHSKSKTGGIAALFAVFLACIW